MPHPQPDGFLALPASGTGPGVLVLHAWWGLNETIKAVCTRLADAGFVAFAPDLYHGQVAKTIAEAEGLGGTVDYQQIKAEIAEAAHFLHEQAAPSDRGVAVIGFSLGAFFALALAAEAPKFVRAVVLFYGTEGTMDSDFSASQADYLGHFAANDEYEPPSNVALLAESLRRAGRPPTFHTYPDTGHWFFEPDVAQAYNPSAASLAWERTLAFLNRPSTL
jgi:carboxymethylenebutenolidase